MSKINQCKNIAIANPTATRQELIEMFLEEVPNISHGAANTYASSVKKNIIAEAPMQAMIQARVAETDEQIDKRLTERFEVIDMLANASCLGQVRSLIVSGPAGLGKSYTIEHAVSQYDPNEERSIIAKGFTRASGLYLLLHEYRSKGSVIVFDDCDSALQDPDSLNLLKAALDTTKKRIISWRAETKMTDSEGNPVDRTFEFEGTVIFITNIDFDEEIEKKTKRSPHLEALVSRSMYVNCDMHTMQDYLVRIRQVVRSGMLRIQKEMKPHEEANVMSFLEENAHKFRELTLRAVLKLADVYKIDSNRFESLAKIALFKPNNRM